MSTPYCQVGDESYLYYQPVSGILLNDRHTLESINESRYRVRVLYEGGSSVVYV